MALLGRGKNSVKIDFGIIDAYKYYKKKVKDPVSKQMFSAIWKEFAEEVNSLMIYDNYEFKYPSRLGTVGIKKRKRNLKLKDDGTLDKKSLVPDWGKCWELWRKEYPGKTDKEIASIKDKPLMYHINEHTDGCVCFWNWDRRTCNVRNHAAYKFRPVRELNRELNDAIKNPNIDVNYYEK